MTTKVLIADDEPDVLESTGMLVESMGYQVSTVRDPNAVLETIERERPGLVLQDLRMGGLNVAALMATLRSNPDTADIPVVFFSANADLPTIAARYDAWGYLAKPFGQEELRRLLGHVLGPGAEHAPRPLAEIRRDVRTAFHDYWNLLAALSNYIQVLDKAGPLPPDAQRAVHGLDEVVLKLESKTDRLRTYVLGVVESLDLPETIPESEREAEGVPTPAGTATRAADTSPDRSGRPTRSRPATERPAKDGPVNAAKDAPARDASKDRRGA